MDFRAKELQQLFGFDHTTKKNPYPRYLAMLNAWYATLVGAVWRSRALEENVRASIVIDFASVIDQITEWTRSSGLNRLFHC